jgi:hypothetical protein
MQNLLLVLVFGLFFNNEPFQVSLGKAPSCEGYNLCNISAGSNYQSSGNQTLAYIEKVDEKHIQFSFTKKSVNDRIFLKYFSTGIFLLDADYELEEDVCNKLEMDRCTLKQGKYKIVDAYDRYVVLFTY